MRRMFAQEDKIFETQGDVRLDNLLRLELDSLKPLSHTSVNSSLFGSLSHLFFTFTPSGLTQFILCLNNTHSSEHSNSFTLCSPQFGIAPLTSPISLPQAVSPQHNFRLHVPSEFSLYGPVSSTPQGPTPLQYGPQDFLGNASALGCSYHPFVPQANVADVSLNSRARSSPSLIVGGTVSVYMQSPPYVCFHYFDFLFASLVHIFCLMFHSLHFTGYYLLYLVIQSSYLALFNSFFFVPSHFCFPKGELSF